MNGKQRGIFPGRSPADLIKGREEEIKRLAETKDGQRVKELMGMNEDELMRAIDEGDAEKLSAALGELMKTREGARFLGQLSGLLGG